MALLSVKTASVVSATNGKVYVVNTDGSKALLKLGDKVLPGQKIQAEDATAFSLAPIDDSVVVADNNVSSEEPFSLPSDVENEIAALQQALLAGADPTQLDDFEAPAAGEEATAGSSIGGSSGISRTGESLLAGSGYDTNSLSVEPPEEIDPIEPRQVIEVSPSVLQTPSIIVSPAGASINSDNVAVAEGDFAIFAINVTNALNSSLSLELLDGSAVSTSDYNVNFEVSLDGGVSWIKYGDSPIAVTGTETVLVRIDTTDDAIREVAESFQLKATLVTGDDTQTEVIEGTIYDDAGEEAIEPNVEPEENDTVFVSISGPNEVTEGQTTSPYTIELSQSVPEGKSVTVELAYTGTAQDGSDFNGVAFVVITGPASTGQFVLSTIDDDLPEAIETIVVSISNIVDQQGAFEAIKPQADSAEVTTNIIDNDSTSLVVNQNMQANNVDVVEGEQATFTVEVGKAAVGSVVTLSLQDGSATLADYEASFEVSLDGGQTWTVSNGQVSLPDGGDVTILVRTQTLDDAYIEAPETYQLNATLVSGSETLQNIGKATILDDSVVNPPTSADTATLTLTGQGSVVEGESATYKVSVDKAPATDLTVKVVVGHITTDNGDVIAQTQDVIIKAGTLSTDFTVATLDDAYADSGEKFQVSLGGTTGGGYENLVKDTSVVETTINDQTGSDRVPGTEDTATISLSGQASVVEGESVTYTVAVDKAPATDITVTVITGHITTDNGDVIAQTQDVVIKAGTLLTDFTIATFDDAYADDGEKFQVSLGDITGGGFENLVKGTSIVETTINDQIGSDRVPGGEDTTTISLSGATTVVEGQSASYTVTVDKAPATDLTVQVITGHITTDNGDVIAQTQDVVIKAGTLSSDFTVATLDDSVQEGSEQFNVTLGTTTGGGYEHLVKGNSVVTTTITDNDSTSLIINPAAQANNVNVVEGEQAIFTVEVGKAALGSVVSLSLTDGTATAADYEATFEVSLDGGATWTVSNGQVNLADGGNQTILVRTQTLDDAYLEPNETYQLNATLVSGSDTLQSTGTATITDDSTVIPPVPADTATISLSGATTVIEGQTASYTVTVDKAPASDLTVQVITGHITTDNGDVIAQTQDVVIKAGTLSSDFTVATLDDSVQEGSEQFNVTLGTTTGGGYEHLLKGNSVVTTTITDNDNSSLVVNPAAQANNVNVVEGEQAIFTVEVGKAALGSVVTLSLQDGTATALDYEATFEVSLDGGATWTVSSGQVSLADGGNQTILVRTQTLDDAYLEPNETYQLNATLVSGSDTLQSTGTATITDDSTVIPPVPADTATISLSGATTVIEGQTASYTVTVDKAPATDLTVQVITGHITTDNGDVVAQTQDVIIKAGETSITFTVATKEDSIKEGDEQFNVTLGTTTGGGYEHLVKGNSAVTTTITDNDSTSLIINPAAQANNVNVVEGEQAIFTVEVGKAALGSVVSLSLIDGTATAADYEATFEVSLDGGATWTVSNGQVSLADGGNQTILVRTQTIDDAYLEPNETYQLNATLVSGSDTLQSTGTATITDDSTVIPPVPADTATISLSGATTVIEGQTASYTVTVDKAPATDLTVQVITGHITTDNGDVVAQTQDVIIKAGETSITFTVATKEDSIKEGDEQFNVTLGTTTGGGYEHLVKGNSAVTTTITDNDSTSLIINPAAQANNVNVVEGEQAIFTVEVGKAALGSVVSLSLIDGTATAADYEATFEVSLDGGATWTVSNGQVSLADGGNQTILVRTQTLDDAYLEPNETYQLNATLVSGSDTLQSTGTATITDDSTVIPPVPADTATISLSGATTVIEGQTASYRVTVDKAPATDLIVEVITGHITTDNGDVVAQTQNVIIKAGTLFTDFTVTTKDDVIKEGEEQFNVTLGTSTGGGYENLVKGNSVVTTTITDNDSTSLIINPAAQANNVNVVEGEQAIFTVEVGKAALGSVVSLSLTDGTATAADYEATFEVSLDGGVTWTVSNGQVSLADGGNQTILVRTQTLDDAYLEPNETYQLNATLVSGSDTLQSTGTATITDDSTVIPPVPADTATISLSGVTTVIEGQTASYRVTVDKAPATDLTVQVITGHITTDNGDVIAQTQDVVIKAGSLFTDFTVITKDDVIKEGEEQFNVTLGTTTGGGYEHLVKGNSVVTTTITDNDNSSLVVNPAAQANNVNVVEGEQAIFIVEVGKAALGSVVTLSLQDGTATALDYEATFEVSLDGGATWTVSNGQVNLADGGNQTILVRTQTLDDAYLEPNETYQLNATLVSGSDTLQSTGTATITDDSTVLPPVPADTATISLSGATTVIEGQTASYRVTVDKAPATDLTVQVITGHITTDNGDVVAQTQDVIIKAGETSIIFTVATKEDSIKEGDEQFNVTLGTTTGGGYENLVKGNSIVTTTITDNDSTSLIINPAAQANNVNVVEGEQAIFTVEVGKAALGSVVSLSLTDGTATAADYEATFEVSLDGGATWTVSNGQVSLADGGNQTILVRTQTLDDAYLEPNETYQLNATLVSGSDTLQSTGTATITDDSTVIPPVPADTATISLSGATTVIEGQTASYRVTVDKAPATDLTVQVITGHITTDNGDVIAQTQDVVIKAGSLFTDFTVTTKDDVIKEGEEQFNVTLGTTTGGGYEHLVKGNSVVTTTITDNDNSSLVVNPAAQANNVNVVEGEQAIFTVEVGKAALGSVVTLSLQDGTATALDYEATFEVSLDGGATWTVSNGQVSLADGGNQTILVRTQTLDDAYLEPNETYQLNATLVSGSDTLQSTGTATITDDSTVIPPVPADTATISLSGQESVVEGEIATYRVSVDKAPATDLIVKVITGHITTDNGDVVAQTQDVIIKAGTLFTDFTVTTKDDVIKEGEEQFSVTLGTTTGGGYEHLVKGNSVVTTTITDNDNSSLVVNPAAQANNVNVVEGEQAIFTVEVGKAALGSVVSLSLTDGTATAADYEATFEVSLDGGVTWTVSNGQVNLADGGNQTILVRTQTLDDAYLEPNETYQLNATLVSGSDTLQSTGTATITDDSAVIPPVPADTATISLSGANTVVEGQSASYRVTVDKAPATDLTVQVITGHITTDNGDVVAQTQDVIIKAGTLFTDFTVTTKDDVIKEGEEQFNVTLGTTTGGGYEHLVKGNSAVTTTITDNDNSSLVVNPAAQANNVTVVEGEQAIFTVEVGKAALGSVVTLSLQDGTATALDYEATFEVSLDGGATWTVSNGQVSLADGGNQTILVRTQTIDDAYLEPNETYQLNATLVSGSDTLQSTGTATITDDSTVIPPVPADTATISLSGQESVVEGESATYRVSVDKAPATDLTVKVITGHITTDNGDVIAQTQDVVIKAGTTETVFSVDTLDDAYADSGERFQVSLGDTVGGGYENLVKGTSVVETIITDQIGSDKTPGLEDTVTVTLAGPTAVAEGALASGYTLTLDAPVPDGKSVTVNLQYTGKAADGTDFTGVKSVVITGPSSSASFDIQTIQDEIYEGAESFVVSIASIVDTNNAFENIIDKGDTVTTVIDDSQGVDNDLPSFTLTAIDGSAVNAVNEGDVAAYQISIGSKGVAAGIDVTLELKMTEGTALNPEDFTGLKGLTYDAAKGVYIVTLTGPLAPNSVVATLNADTVEDTVYEANEKFTVSLESTSLGSVSGVVETTILNDDAPLLAPVDVTVNEAGLVDGSNPGAGHIVSGNLLGSDASLSITEIAGGTLDPSTGIITVTTAKGVLTVETTGANAGQYQYQLNDTFSHAQGQGTNTADNANSFDITVSGHNGVTTNLTLNVDIVDDIPTANIVSPDLIDFTQQTTNLIFVLDVSGSMGWDMEGDNSSNVNWGGTSRIEIAKQSLTKLIDAYSNLGDVNIKIVSFRHQLDVESDWLTLADAKALLNTLNADNGTDYDDALRALVDGFNPPTKADGSAADLTKVYFLSDGEPNEATDKQEIIDYQSTWQTFVEQNNIEAEAIGIGSNVPTQYLDIVAHPTKADGSEPTQVVTTANGLLTVLLDSVKAVVTGNVDTKVTGSVATGINYGADGGFIESIEVDGVVYNRPVGPDFKVKIDTQNGGELVFDFASGEYSYVVTMGDKPANTDTFADNIIVNVVDNDGDRAKSDFDISVKFPVIDTTPVANLDTDTVTEAVGQPENASSAIINGNVLINDMYGKEIATPVVGAAVGEQVGNVSGGTGQVLVGSFGTLILNSDGTYTYTLDNKNGQVQALDRNQTLQDKFTYTISDDNGDLSSATLVITVRGVTDPMLDAIDDSASTFAGQPVYVDILNNDVNPADSNQTDNDKEITIQSVKVLTGAGQAYIVDGELVYIPGKSKEIAQIEYTITNSRGEVDTAVVTINVTERDFTGSTLDGESGNDQITTVSGTDTGSKDFQLQLGGYNGYVTNSDGTRTFVNIGARDERKVMTQEEQLIDSSGGNDYVKGSVGSDTIYLGDGFRETDEASTKAFLDKEALKDQAELDAYHTSSVSSSIVDIADGGAGDDIIYGGSQGVDDPNATHDALERPISHYDYIYGNDGNDMIDGGLGYDLLRGGSGNDTIIGGLGDDDLAGNSGNDILIGGEGRDTFRFFAEDVILESGNDKQLSGNKDTIIDFNLAEDKLDLRDLLQGESENTIDQFLQATENANGGIDLVVDADGVAGGDTMTITLDGLRYSDAGAATGEDFIQKLIQDGNLIIDK